MGRSTSDVPPELLQKQFKLPDVSGGGGEPEELFLYKLTVPQLKNLCARYDLKKSGNKPDLLQRLLDLSDNWESWSRVKNIAKRTHKGPQPGSKTKLGKRSRRRRTEVAVLASTSSIRHGAKDTRTQDEVDEQFELARAFITAHPEYSKPHQRGSAKKAIVAPSLATRVNGLEATVCQLINSQTRYISDVLPLPQHVPDDSNARQSHLLSHNPARSATSSTTFTLPPAPVAQVHIQDVEMADVALDEALDDKPRIRSLRLFDGTVLTFDQTKIPDPPRYSFAKRLDELGILWSDDHSDFKKHEDRCIVTVNGRYIAYKYWPDVFKHKVKNCADRRWRKLKKTWYIWSLIGRYYTERGKDKFWEEFSEPNGKQMCQTHIKNILKARNVARREALKAKGVMCESDSDSDAEDLDVGLELD